MITAMTDIFVTEFAELSENIEEKLHCSIVTDHCSSMIFFLRLREI